MSHNVDFTHYGGFQSYGIKQVSTSKPGQGDFYQKNSYKEMSDYNKRRVSFYNDKTRMKSVYSKDIINSINEKDYKDQTNRGRLEMALYDYSHDDGLVSTIKDGKNKKEETIRQRFSESTDKTSRKRMFSHWESTWDADSAAAVRIKQETNFKQSKIPDQYKSNYHVYHSAIYKTDHTTNFGVHGDRPIDKFNLTMMDGKVTNKLFNDNYQIGEGTTKASTYIPGYQGHIPINFRKPADTLTKEPYFNVGKTNHVLSFKTRIPGYSGYIPFSTQNIKGTVRPNCLSVEGETFK